MATQNDAADVVNYLAMDHSYFQREAIAVELVSFSSGSEMIPAMATDQVEVATVGSNPAAWNALARGVGFKMLLDRGSFYGDYGAQFLVVRKDLYDRGLGRRLEDLRNMSLAITPPGKATLSARALAAGLQRIGMSLDEVTILPLPFPKMVAALGNGAVDAGMVSEPFLGSVVRRGSAVKAFSVGELYPGFQLGVVGFSRSFYANRPVAKAYVRAYLRAARAYNEALAGRPGELTRAQVDEAVARYTRIDVATVREMVPPGMRPNGQPHRDSIMYCYQYFRDQGLVPEPVSEAAFAALWGTELVDEALAEIGRVPES